MNIKLFSGNSNLKLARSLCSKLNMNLSNFSVNKFSDGEISVFIKDSVKNAHCCVIQSTSYPVNDNLMELLIMIDALKRNGASKITLIIPYFGYARQDKNIQGNEPITARLVANLIETAGADEVLISDIHSYQTLGYFSIPVFNIESKNIFFNYIKDKLNFNSKDFLLVSPDCGGIARVRSLSKLLDSEIVIIDKYRKKSNVSEVVNIIGEVKNKKLIIIDDIIDTAGTICNTIEKLIEKGASEVSVCACHAVLSGKSVEKLKNVKVNKVVFLNTIFIPDEKMLKNFEIIDISSEIIKFIN